MNLFDRKRPNRELIGRRKSSSLPKNRSKRLQPRTVPSPQRYGGAYYLGQQRSGDPNKVQRLSGANAARGSAQRLRQKLLRASLKRRRLALGCVIAACCLLVFCFTYVGSSVTVVFDNSGLPAATLLHSKQDYADAASKLISGSLVNHNKLTIDTSGIIEQLSRQFPELRDVQIEVPLIGFSPTLIVRPGLPTAALQPTSGTTVIVDRTGFVVGDLSAKQNNSSALPLIVDQSGLELKRGTQALPSTTMDFVVSLLSQLKAHKVSLESIVLPQNGVDELDVRVSGLSYYAKFSVHDPATFNQQIGSYFALLDYLNRQSVSPVEYIDVRLPGRAYYK